MNDSDPQYQVGFRRLAIRDAELGVSFPTLIFYPTATQAQPTRFGPFTVTVAQQAPIAEGAFPLVLVSHGSGGSPMTFRTLASYLAERGWAVCLPEHLHNNRFDDEWAYSLENLTNRPRHLHLCIDQVLAHPEFGDAVKGTGVGVIGHSVGGYTALALAGGLAHTGFLIEHCEQPEHAGSPLCKLVQKLGVSRQAIPTVTDSRVRSLILFDPDVSLFLGNGGLTDVTIQMSLWLAEMEDHIGATLAALKDRISADRLRTRIVEHATHYSFLSPFPPAIKARAGKAGWDPNGFDRRAFHAELFEDTAAFLDRTVG